MTNNIGANEKASPKHVFLHLFVIIMLYFSAVNLLILLFQYINYFIADALYKTNYYQFMFSSGLIRFALASLIIVFPIFIFTSQYLNKCYTKSPAIREMRIRKWLIYFTLFVAALVMVGDLVRIILTFLEGEMTVRFILKALSILFVTGLIFYYYLCDLKKEEKPRPEIKYFIWGIIVIVLAAIVAGFFIVGSPKNERLRRFDYDRLGRLQEIQWQVINYWRSKEYLPVVLSDLNDEISGFVAPVDPETNEPFEYNVIAPDTFELCAKFNLASDQDQTSYYAEPMYYGKSGSENWKHEAGRACFERKIDKELYPPYPIKN
jgi:hypothetical protein